MPSLDPHSWMVRRRRVSFPKNFQVFVATREQVPMELELPEIGTDASAILGNAYAGCIITDSWDNLRTNKRTMSFECSEVPKFNAAGDPYVEFESMGYVFPPVYPRIGSALTNFPGGSVARPRTVLGKVEYLFTRDAATLTEWQDEATTGTGLTDGPLQVRSLLVEASATDYEAADGNWYKVGQWLQSYFISQDTVHDGMNISITGDLAYTIGASSPSATVYDGWVTAKSYFIADRTVSKWRGDIYMKRTRKVRAQ